MNINKINNIYTAVANKENAVSTLNASEWNNISTAVNISHIKINEIADALNTFEDNTDSVPENILQRLSDLEEICGKYETNANWLYLIKDNNYNQLGGVQPNGDFKWNYNFYAANFQYTQDSQYIYKIVDANENIVFGIKTDGSCYINGENISGRNESIEGISWEQYPGYLQATLDSNSTLISGIKTDGTVYHKNLEVDNLILKNSNIGTTDWSSSKEVILPLPKEGAMVNLIIPEELYSKYNYMLDKISQNYSPFVNEDGLIKRGLAYKKGLDWECEIEYWDKLGNYFKKPIILNAQGNSSMAYEVNNLAFDLNDGSTIKFGNWVSLDSFHLKKYYQDAFRGQCIVAYRLIELMMNTNTNVRPWDYLIEGHTTLDGSGTFAEDFNTGALGHPDGFPIELFCNGVSVGVYTFNLKKHRDNYYMKKNKTNHILLDGIMGADEFWNGNIDWAPNVTHNNGDGIEVRNPKPKKSKDGWKVVDINGNDYDGDNPTELIGSDSPNYDSSNTDHVKTAQTKAAIIRLSSALAAIDAEDTDENKKAVAEQYFLIPQLIDYCIFGNVLYNYDGFRKNWIWGTWDGEKWAPTVYDCDSIFGSHWRGNYILPSSITNTLGSGNIPSKYMVSGGLYWDDTVDRYVELRRSGILTTENIMNLLNNWLDQVGYDRLKKDLTDIFPNTPSYRSGKVNTEYWQYVPGVSNTQNAWNSTSTYSENDIVYYNYTDICYKAIQNVPAGEAPCELYPYYITEGGYFNSPIRVKKWLDARFAVLDEYYQPSSSNIAEPGGNDLVGSN